MIRWYRDQPQLLKRVTADMLNEFAFSTRTRALGVLNREMTIRNPKFVKGRLRVSKARPHARIGNQRSITGSVAKDRFTGWVEQESGQKTLRNRQSTLAGRKGDQKKQMRHVVRLKPKNDVITANTDGFQPKGGRNNLGGLLAIARRKKENRLIRYKSSFYKRKRNKFELVQQIKPVQPKRIRWIKRARLEYFKYTDINNTWRRISARHVKPPRKS